MRKSSWTLFGASNCTGKNRHRPTNYRINVQRPLQSPHLPSKRQRHVPCSRSWKITGISYAKKDHGCRINVNTMIYHPPLRYVRQNTPWEKRTYNSMARQPCLSCLKIYTIILSNCKAKILAAPLLLPAMGRLPHGENLPCHPCGLPDGNLCIMTIYYENLRLS